MQTHDLFYLLDTLDIVAAVTILVLWQGFDILAEHPPNRYPSTTILMARYRRAWMCEFVTRDPRIFDAQVMSSLRQGASFFASACMIAVGGAVALIGNADLLSGVAQDLTLESAPTIVWEIKLMFMSIFAINAFLKFVWSHRLFGYCAVLMAAVPNDISNPIANPRAAKAAEINITAARSYTRGLRAIYFGIASAAWLINAEFLLAAALFTTLVVIRREFASESRAVLLSDTDDDVNTDT
ncbi:MAG: DUF599 domain-containing protein [Rhodobacteraceae bacterium]|nr:DUF599 domain-containing protein [Paracoccaceae bacterium]